MTKNFTQHVCLSTISRLAPEQQKMKWMPCLYNLRTIDFVSHFTEDFFYLLFCWSMFNQFVSVLFLVTFTPRLILFFFEIVTCILHYQLTFLQPREICAISYRRRLFLLHIPHFFISQPIIHVVYSACFYVCLLILVILFSTELYS